MSRARSNDSTPGVLFLIVGPSGAGKDSLIDAARARFAGLKDITFIERVITRPSCAGGEAHRGVTAAAFERLYRSGRFILTWSVHGLDYGIPIEVCDAIEGGTSAVVNVSRGVVAEAETLFAQVVVINVTAGHVVTRMARVSEHVWPNKARHGGVGTAERKERMVMSDWLRETQVFPKF